MKPALFKDITKLTTFGVSTKVRNYLKLNNHKEIQNALPIAKASKLPLLILGGGSNLLFKEDFDGFVLHINIKGIDIQETDSHYFVHAGAGENWHKLVLHCVEKGIGGLENLSLIPGNCGAAPIQNIGAYGVEIKDIIHHVDFVWIQSGKKGSYTAKACKFGYRNSIFKQRLKGQVIITGISLKLPKKHVPNISYGSIEQELESMKLKTKPSIKNVSDAVIAIRESKLPDPKEVGNAGSFFKNPTIASKKYLKLKETYPEIPGYPNAKNKDFIKVPAGWLIEKAGLKGKTIGNYGVHKKQALVLVNYGGALGKDIYEFSEEILKTVKKNFGIELEREVNCI